MSAFPLLSRDQFRAAVFARERDTCAVCPQSAVDAHHILERRLWPDGGYYLANGVAVCAEHHLAAENTLLSCSELRQAVGITKYPLPPHLYDDQEYDKWGNPILPNGMRLRGELFDDPSVQKVLAPVLHLFTSRVKYPRTWHLPWSPGVTKDDRVLTDLGAFVDREVVVTVKMDGENTTLYSDGLHARSLDYESHPSRSRIKALQAQLAGDIPEGWRVCGENLYAQHSIAYSHLEAHFLAFSIWTENNTCLSWDQTVEWCSLLGLCHVPVLYRGLWGEALVRKLHADCYGGDPCEGYVVRLADSFHYRDFRRAVAKYVRQDHVQTHGHWMRQQVVPNQLRRTAC